MTNIELNIEQALKKGRVQIIISSFAAVRDIAKATDLPYLIMEVETLGDARKLEYLVDLFNRVDLRTARRISERIIQDEKNHLTDSKFMLEPIFKIYYENGDSIPVKSEFITRVKREAMLGATVKRGNVYVRDLRNELTYVRARSQRSTHKGWVDWRCYTDD